MFIEYLCTAQQQKNWFVVAMTGELITGYLFVVLYCIERQNFEEKMIAYNQFAMT